MGISANGRMTNIEIRINGGLLGIRQDKYAGISVLCLKKFLTNIFSQID
jgi:hypothetical protein